MKKILLLGGSAQQIVAIEAAKKLGYYTVLCDYLTDNPGQYHADRFYLVSTIDKEAVLQVAKDEKIDGVLAYASDPAAPTAAYVAEQLGLPTNPASAVNTLCNKDRFRKFLRENGLPTPFAKGYAAEQSASEETGLFRLPVIVKPVDSSGSKGATVLHDWAQLDEAVAFALSFSREKRYIIEEYIEKGYPYVIGGDVFVVNGKVEMWGLMNCHRDSNVNPLVPVGKSFPTNLAPNVENAVKDTIQRILTSLGYSNGPVNVELIVDQNQVVWPIDFGPRCGGNMIPVLMQRIFSVDIPELSVRAALGEELDLHIHQSEHCFATYNLHSDRAGTLAEIRCSNVLRPYIKEIHMYSKTGDPVEYFDNASKALGILIMEFTDRSFRDRIMSEIRDHIITVLEEDLTACGSDYQVLPQTV